VLEIDEHSHQATEFGGGYEAFIEERAVARRHAEEAYETYVEQRDSLAQRAQRERQWATRGVNRVKKSGETDKFIRHFRTQSSEQLAARAKRSEKAIERLTEVEKPWEGWDLRFEIASTGRAGDVIARLEGVVVERGNFVLGPIDLSIGWGERVAILGANGSGKTTLLSVVLGHRAPDEGSAYLGPGVVPGTLEQARARFDTAGTMLAAFEAASGLLAQESRSLLAKFGLGADHVTRPASSLSPGERTRAELALLMARGVNCLILDEPTNHLDLAAIEQLEQALASFDGTLLLVSHDRRLLDAVSLTRRVMLESGRIVTDEAV
jgi:ATPase subunit of ABC transporter with duplicated ATPase domains